MAYVRTVKTASGATAVQIVWSSRRGSRSIEHLGSAHDEAEVAALKAAAAQRLAAGQAELDLGLADTARWRSRCRSPRRRSAHLWDALCRAYDVLGFDEAAGGDEVFRAAGVGADHRADQQGRLAAGARRDRRRGRRRIATVKRRLPVLRQTRLSGKHSRRRAPRTPRWGRRRLVLYDVSTLYFETDAGDGFREPGFSKERRLEPQITIGLLTDAAGFPLAVEAFEGNKAETATMLPVINAFKAAHQLTDVTVVADAGMISEANQVALQAAGLSFILGARIPFLPDVVREWRDKHPGEAVPDGLVLTQPWPATSSEKARGIPDRVIYYQYRHDRARRTLRGIDEQVAKAQTRRRRAGRGQTQPVHQADRGDQERQPRAGGQDPGPGRAGRATPPTSPAEPRSSSSAPTTSCGASRRASGCPSTTCRPARSTTTPANRSKPT